MSHGFRHTTEMQFNLNGIFSSFTNGQLILRVGNKNAVNVRMKYYAGNHNQLSKDPKGTWKNIHPHVNKLINKYIVSDNFLYSSTTLSEHT